MSTATYPVLQERWVRPSDKVVCPECQGLRWLPIELWEAKADDFVAVTLDCPFCHGRGWVESSEGDGRGYERSLSNG